MTEYDYSPAAYERFMQTQNRVSHWVDRQSSAAPKYSNPLAFTPSEADERARNRFYTDSPGPYEQGHYYSGGGGGQRQRSRSLHHPGGRDEGRPPPARSRTYHHQSHSSSTTSFTATPPPHRSSSPRRSNSQSTRSSRHTHTSSRHTTPTYYVQPQPTYPAQYSNPQPTVVYTQPPHHHHHRHHTRRSMDTKPPSLTSARVGPVQVYGSNGSYEPVVMKPGQQAIVRHGRVEIIPIPSSAATRQPYYETTSSSPNYLTKKPGSHQPLLKKLFSGWGSSNSKEGRTRRSSH
ncbi:hypothetical protein JAAARDRAFT_56901 [Jaapia argillacea MUCL 33604]|uniref:Uncharacterized protein n=1 Tax=Jaapia argillacea MUCL 33604 TaxID=933084 RepID=A0A067PVJ4_9AGAM|nr:hypothetical protein JAAARDRAFT_56901 [Jaapia argillacea MUCL 33604]